MLPTELWYKIIAELKLSEQLRIQQVCRTFEKISEQHFEKFIQSIYNWSINAPYVGVYGAYDRTPQALSQLSHTNVGIDDGIMKVEAYYKEHPNFKSRIQNMPYKYLWRLLQRLTQSATDFSADADENVELRFLMATSIILNCKLKRWMPQLSKQYHYLYWWYQTYSLDSVAGIEIVSLDNEEQIDQLKTIDPIYTEIFS